MQKWSHDVIGTHLEILLDTQQDCAILFDSIASRLWYFEEKFSRFIEWNWLYQLNISRRWQLDTDARSMLLYALEVAKKTQGYFDPTVGKRLTELGYGNQWIMNNEEWKISEKWYGDYRDIEIDWDEVILHGDILLEFGGVGKGYLIDVIKEMIDNRLCHIDRNSLVSVTNGVEISCSENWAGFLGSAIAPLEMTETRYLINFGWDMYGCGGWKIGLESPFAADEVIGTYILDDGFLACSAGTKRKWWDGKHHLIDPHTGESAREVVASYIEGSSGISVDSYATALCVMPWEWAVDTLQKTPEISGVIVKYNGTLFQKEGNKSELFS